MMGAICWKCSVCGVSAKQQGQKNSEGRKYGQNSALRDTLSFGECRAPSISMRQALSAFTSGWSTAKRSGEQVEIKRVTEIQMYFFSGYEVTLSAVKITAALQKSGTSK